MNMIITCNWNPFLLLPSFLALSRILPTPSPRLPSMSLGLQFFILLRLLCTGITYVGHILELIFV